MLKDQLALFQTEKDQDKGNCKKWLIWFVLEFSIVKDLSKNKIKILEEDLKGI